MVDIRQSKSHSIGVERLVASYRPRPNLESIVLPSRSWICIWLHLNVEHVVELTLEFANRNPELIEERPLPFWVDTFDGFLQLVHIH